MKAWLFVFVFVVACSSPRQASAPVAPRVQTGGGDPHAQIEDLAHKIEQDQQNLAHPTPGVRPMAATTAPVSPLSTTDTTCHPAPTDTCSDTCTLADSICDSSKKICELADQLAGDTWAAEKCTSAKQSCDSAHAKCCGCQP